MLERPKISVYQLSLVLYVSGTHLVCDCTYTMPAVGWTRVCSLTANSVHLFVHIPIMETNVVYGAGESPRRIAIILLLKLLRSRGYRGKQRSLQVLWMQLVLF